MAGPSSRRPAPPIPAATSDQTRFRRRLSEILEHATEVFYEKGYEGASMRDLSRKSGMSLAGLYYYFESKEKLLYLVQKHTFSTVMERLKQRLAAVTDPQERIRVFIFNHLEYFLANMKAMTVLSREAEALGNSLGREILDMKRDYYHTCLDLMEDLRRQGSFAEGVTSRTAVLGLFGMLNWIYTWHNPRLDPGVEELGRQMSEIFLHGITRGLPQQSEPPRKTRSR